MTAHQLASLRRRSWLVALAVLLVGFVATGHLVWQQEQRQAEAMRSTALNLATDHARAIESRIERLMSSTYLLAAMVRKDKGQVLQFEEVAGEILPFFPGVSSLALSPGGIIRHAVPIEPNRNSIGFNQLTDPIQGPQALLTRDSGQLTLAGPMELKQGGLGAVGRLPIFLPDHQGRDAFWGFANVVIRFPKALAATGLDGLNGLGYEFELWRTDVPTQTRQTIIRSTGFQVGSGPERPVDKVLHIPNGEWTLSIMPRNGWINPVRLATNAALGALFCFLLAYLSKLLVDQRLHQRQLEHQVKKRTARILEVQDELRATLDAIPDLMLELDLQGRLHQIHAYQHDPLALPAERIPGRTIYELLPPEVCQVTLDAMREARENGRSIGHQYALEMPDGKHWYELSVSHKLTGADTDRFIAMARDITARKQAESDLLLVAKVFEQSSEAFVITDARQQIIKVNPAFSEITGYSPQEVVGHTPAMLSSGRHGLPFYREMWKSLTRTGHWQGEIWNRRRNGDIYPEWLSITRVQDDADQTTHYIAIFTDTTQRKAQEAKIRSLAYYDPLTGLANRSLLKDRVQHDLSQAKRHGLPLSLLFIDLDHFKNINDSLGHQVGDNVLIGVGERLRQSLREQDTVARLGGDEFVAVLPETGSSGAAHKAQALLQQLSMPYEIEQHELTITPSIGIALYPDDGADFDTLYRCADTAMHKAKQDGRNGYSFFTHEMQEQSIRRLQIENALRRALEREQFSLYYQPQLSLSTGEVVGVEALLRWNHPEWGSVSPAEFIPVAENSGQILAMGEWVLRTAVAQLKHWLDGGFPAMTMAVNLSAVQFRQPQLPELVVRVLRESGLSARHLELELTESAAMHDPESAIETINALRERGILMSVDDFGTGYSSLNYLKRFQVYKLKIDRSFVRDVLNDPEDANIVTAIINMAHGLGMKTIAEGVETPGQLEFLRARGCDEIQGHYLSRPLSVAEFEAFMHERLNRG